MSEAKPIPIIDLFTGKPWTGEPPNPAEAEPKDEPAPQEGPSPVVDQPEPPPSAPPPKKTGGCCV